MNRQLPKVTVLMPVYNGVPYISWAIRSVLGQTFTDFEFLIIDDGSTDASVEVIKAFEDSRIRLNLNGANLGLVASLNKGLDLARGEFIARMDADDISRPDRLARQVCFMDANPSVGVCGSWVQFFPKRKNLNVWKLPQKTAEIQCWQFHSVGVAHPSVMIRRQQFVENELLYDPHYIHIEDYELWGRAMQYMDFANIQKVLLDYRISPEQICSTYGAEQLLAVAPLRLQRVRELGLEPSQAEQQLHEMIMNGKVPPESACLDRADMWLARLESANKSVGAYPADLFARRLLEIWFSTCLSFADTSACSWRRCLQSPLWSIANVSAWYRLRALGAWILRKGLWDTIRGQRHV